MGARPDSPTNRAEAERSTTIDTISLADDPEPWEAIGFAAPDAIVTLRRSAGLAVPVALMSRAAST